MDLDRPDRAAVEIHRQAATAREAAALGDAAAAGTVQRPLERTPTPTEAAAPGTAPGASRDVRMPDHRTPPADATYGRPQPRSPHPAPSAGAPVPRPGGADQPPSASAAAGRGTPGSRPTPPAPVPARPHADAAARSPLPAPAPRPGDGNGDIVPRRGDRPAQPARPDSTPARTADAPAARSADTDSAEQAAPAKRTPDLRTIIPQVQSGDAAARQTLETVTKNFIDTALANSRLSDDMRAEAVVDAQLRLGRPTFNPAQVDTHDLLPRRAVQVITADYKRFVDLVTTAAVVDTTAAFNDTGAPSENTPLLRIVFGTALKRHVADPQPGTARPHYANQELGAAIPLSLVRGSLSQNAVNMFCLRRIGLSNAEVADALVTTLNYVTATLSLVRLIVERDLLTPAGLKELSEYPDMHNYMHKLLSRGDMPALMFLGRWYVTDEWVPQPLDKDPNYVTVASLMDAGASRGDIAVFRRQNPGVIVPYKIVRYLPVSHVATLQAITAARLQRESGRKAKS